MMIITLFILLGSMAWHGIIIIIIICKLSKYEYELDLQSIK